MKFSKIKLKNGFTLIELLITMAVLGVLITGAVSILNPAAQLQKAQDARRKSDIAQIQKALEMFYQDARKYPDSTTDSDSCGNVASCPYRIKTLDATIKNWGDSWLPYMGNLPVDPSSSKRYVYISTGQTYYIYASLDRETNNPSSAPTGGCGSGVTCNYGVSSPNVNP